MLMSLGRIAMAENSTLGTCLWCGRGFTPRATGGKTQRFCRPRCRRAFDAAGRRWIAVALTSGALTIAHLKSPLKNDLRATRALLPGAVSPAPVHEPQKPAPVAPAEQRGEAAELLDEFS